MDNVEMVKKASFLSSQGKELLPECETVTVFTKEELERFKKEACSTYSNGKRKYKQAAAYILMLNTGVRPGEALALKNSDIDLENKRMYIHKTLKEVNKREGTKKTKGLHTLRHTFATNLVNGITKDDGTVKSLTPK